MRDELWILAPDAKCDHDRTEQAHITSSREAAKQKRNQSAPKRDAAKTLKTVRASNGVHAKTRVWENIGSGSTGNAENIKVHGTQLTFDSPHQANASRRNIGPGQLQKLLQTSGHAVASAHRTIGRGQLQDRVRNAAADALR